MASEGSQPETAVLLTTLAGLASSTKSIDESVRRIASALESQSSPSPSQRVALPYDEKNQLKKKDEEIIFLKEYIRMKHTYDKSVEANSKQKDDAIEEMKAVVLEKEKLISQKDNTIQGMETAMKTMKTSGHHKTVIEHKDKLNRQKDGIISAQGKTIAELSAKVTNLQKGFSTSGEHDNLIQQKDDIICARGKTIYELSAKISNLQKALTTEGEQYWSEFFEKVMNEVEGVQSETSPFGNFGRRVVHRAAKRFLDMMNARASEVANLPLPSTSQVSGVKHDMEMADEKEVVKRVKRESEE